MSRGFQSFFEGLGLYWGKIYDENPSSWDSFYLYGDLRISAILYFSCKIHNFQEENTNED